MNNTTTNKTFETWKERARLQRLALVNKFILEVEKLEELNHIFKYMALSNETFKIQMSSKKTFLEFHKDFKRIFIGIKESPEFYLEGNINMIDGKELNCYDTGIIGIRQVKNHESLERFVKESIRLKEAFIYYYLELKKIQELVYYKQNQKIQALLKECSELKFR